MADPTNGAIKTPFTFEEIERRIAGHDYSAELLLQHAMLLLRTSQEPAPTVPPQLLTAEGVHAAMLRGQIAKISMLQCAHTHGEQAVTDYRALTESQAPAQPTRESLIVAVQRMHKAKGRYHSQIATCDLFDLLKLPCVRPGHGDQEPAQPAPAVLSDDDIRRIYSEETGFILDESPAALLDFARAVLAAQPVRGSAQPDHTALLRQALEAWELETSDDWNGMNSYHPKLWDAIAAIRSALATTSGGASLNPAGDTP